MKKYLLILAFAIGVALPFSASAFVDLGKDRLTGGGRSAGYSVDTTTETTFAEIVGEVIAVALSLVGAIFLVITFYAGFLWMTAHGDEQQVDKSKNMIRQSMIGLAVVLGAYSITNFVVPRLVAKTTGGAASQGGEPLKPGDTLCCIKTDEGTGNEVSRRIVQEVSQCYSSGFFGIGSGCSDNNVDGHECQAMAMPAEQCK
ncbi:hypothetical protein H6758_02925 [Candidatus Nomurabacteria bacterium]|nr:hypothetical protein [Candidatus Nomurabacteria bacterium]